MPNTSMASVLRKSPLNWSTFDLIFPDPLTSVRSPVARQPARPREIVRRVAKTEIKEHLQIIGLHSTRRCISIDYRWFNPNLSSISSRWRHLFSISAPHRLVST